jgi:DNA-directed RNA polymerase specialized sigma24 family protein
VSPLEALRASVVAASRRYSRVAHEVEDLAHDIILSALRRGVPLEGEAFLRTADGAARRHGAFLARTAGRRRARELRDGERVDVGAQHVEVDVADDEGAPLSGLSPSLRTTLLLLFLGLDKAELRHALGLTDAALRKRFQALRDHAPLARPHVAVPSRTPALVQLRRSQVGLLQRLAGPEAGAGEGREPARRVVAASDPDGHGIIFAEVLTPAGRTATAPARDPDAPPTGPRTHANRLCQPSERGTSSGEGHTDAGLRKGRSPD